MFFSSSPIKALKRVRIITLLLSLLGTALSGYSIYVHYKKGADKNYNAYCDVRDDISCSKVFTSKYGKGFGFLSALLGEESPLIVSNGIYGIIFYALIIVLGELTSVAAAQIQRLLIIATNLLSVYLAYILAFVLKDKCVVCISIYAINFLILVCCFIRVRNLNSLKSKKKGGSNKSEKKTANSQQQNSNNKKEGKKSNQNYAKSNQNSTKNEQNSNKINPVSNKNIQNETKKSKKNTEVVNNKNAVNNRKNTEQIKNVQNSNKNQQNSNKNVPTANKNSSNKSNAANSNKHSKKKN